MPDGRQRLNDGKLVILVHKASGQELLNGPSGVRCSYRGWYLPPSRSGTGPGDSDYLGFRVAR